MQKMPVEREQRLRSARKDTLTQYKTPTSPRMERVTAKFVREPQPSNGEPTIYQQSTQWQVCHRPFSHK